MDDLNEFDKFVLRNLIADNWSEFVAECADYEVDPAKLFVKAGGNKDEIPTISG